MRTFTLETPADPGYLPTVRLFVAAAARSCGTDPDALDDLKLGTTEAVTSLLSTGGSIRTSVSCQDAGVEVAVSGPGPLIDGNDTDLVLGLELARAVLGELDVTSGPAGTTLVFRA